MHHGPPPRENTAFRWRLWLRIPMFENSLGSVPSGARVVEIAVFVRTGRRWGVTAGNAADERNDP